MIKDILIRLFSVIGSLALLLNCSDGKNNFSANGEKNIMLDGEPSYDAKAESGVEGEDKKMQDKEWLKTCCNSKLNPFPDIRCKTVDCEQFEPTRIVCKIELRQKNKNPQIIELFADKEDRVRDEKMISQYKFYLCIDKLVIYIDKLTSSNEFERITSTGWPYGIIGKTEMKIQDDDIIISCSEKLSLSC